MFLSNIRAKKLLELDESFACRVGVCNASFPRDCNVLCTVQPVSLAERGRVSSRRRHAQSVEGT